jgi:hypothetical protein
MSPASPSISVLATEAGRLHSLGLVLRALAQVEQSSAGAPRCVYGGVAGCMYNITMWHLPQCASAWTAQHAIWSRVQPMARHSC